MKKKVKIIIIVVLIVAIVVGCIAGGIYYKNSKGIADRSEVLQMIIHR